MQIHGILMPVDTRVNFLKPKVGSNSLLWISFSPSAVRYGVHGLIHTRFPAIGNCNQWLH